MHNFLIIKRSLSIDNKKCIKISHPQTKPLKPRSGAVWSIVMGAMLGGSGGEQGGGSECLCMMKDGVLLVNLLGCRELAARSNMWIVCLYVPSNAYYRSNEPLTSSWRFLHNNNIIKAIITSKSKQFMVRSRNYSVCYVQEWINRRQICSSYTRRCLYRNPKPNSFKNNFFSLPWLNPQINFPIHPHIRPHHLLASTPLLPPPPHPKVATLHPQIHLPKPTTLILWFLY